MLQELRWDTRVKETDVGVEVDRGIVTLTGTVDSWAARHAAQDAAHRVAVYWPSDDIEREAKKALETALVEAKERYPKTESALVCGEQWRAILEVATERDVDLIVMGTHGRRGLSRLFLGSVAEKVVRLSPVPVLTVSTEAEKKAKALALAHGADATKR